MASRDRLAFELAADVDAAGEARRRVVEAAQDCVGDSGAETLGLLVSEVVTNAVVHGGRDGTLAVDVAHDGHSVRVEVADRGAGFVPRPRALDSDQVGGWGLYLVEQLAHAWGVSSGGRTRVWFELPCEDSPRAA